MFSSKLAVSVSDVNSANRDRMPVARSCQGQTRRSALVISPVIIRCLKEKRRMDDVVGLGAAEV